MTRAPNRSRARRRILVVVATTFAALALVWLAHAVSRSREYYDYTKSGARGWRGRVHVADPVLGLVPAPNARGAETYPIGPDVQSRIDANGYRVPIDDIGGEAKRPLVLALGCSMTYGSSVLAEETFAWRVARRLGGTCRNAGICGAGAAQVLLLARERIPREKPDIVLAQYSGWLFDRSRQDYAPTWIGRVPTPHFVRTDRGVELEPPAFRARVFDLPFDDYRDTPRGFFDEVGFCARIGIPLAWHDDFANAFVQTKRALGLSPPFASMEEIERAVYPEIARLCRDNGARVVFVWLETQPIGIDYTVPPVLREIGAPVAVSGPRLVAELPEKTRAAYIATYTLMRGDPPRCVDGHPNARAHELIADEIARALDAR